jgi:hypothetical protein
VAQGRTARFIGPADWSALLGRTDVELRRRWREEPWILRPA